MRTDETLEVLREKGTDGISCADLSAHFKFKLPTSASKIITRLIKEGHNIKHDKIRKVYVLLSQKSSKKSEDIENTSEDIGEISLRTPLKKELVYQCLENSGSKGATSTEISEYAGIETHSVCGHIHTLRKNPANNIKTINGTYILKKGKRNNTPTKSYEPSQASPNNPAQDLDKTIGIKVLLKGAERVLPEDLDGYMALVKKVIYYGKCAAAMIETNDVLENINVGE